MIDKLLLTLLAGATILPAQGLLAQTNVASEAERAIVRSQENLIGARNLMKEAQKKQASKDLKGAYLDATQAIAMAPSGKAASDVRKSLVSDYTVIALAYARDLASDGVFSDRIAERNGILSPEGTPLSAESVAKSILDPEVNPTSKAAVAFLSDLEQPEVFNKTVTPKFAAQRDEVARLLRDASQLEQSGRHDLARKQYEAALLIDPYNNAARKGMEAIDNAVLKYGDEAYNETRSRLLWQVEKAWERPPRKPKQGRSTESVGRQQDSRGTDEIVAKLNSIIIPKIDLNDSPVSEAIEYLKQKSAEQSPDKRGVNIFLKLGSSAPAPAASATATVPGALPGVGGSVQPAAPSAEPHVTLSLSHVPLYVALDYLSKLSNLKLKIDPYAVSIVPLSEPTDILITKEYKVPPSFIPQKLSDTNSSIPMPGAAPSSENAPRVASKYNAKDYLQLQGVQFPDGASANYIPMGSKLVVRNTRDNIDLIDGLVDAAMGESPTQVSIETKFLEINQNNLEELGFDWLLGPLSIGGGMYGAGGGNSANVNNANYPFVQGSSAVGMNPVGALRSGDSAISPNSIDALLAGKTGITDAASPGIFSIAGVYTDPQFQLVIHALSQKKGIDLMSAPKVTTKSGVQATVKIVNEFKYPKAYDQPQIPQSTGQNGVTIGGTFGTVNQPPPTVTPAFPRDFATENLGVVLVAKPTIGPDGYTIDMELDPKVTDFDGFINYGSPINSAGYQPQPGTGLVVQVPVAQTLTTNVINQPVFTVREVNTYVTVWDGQTVALGGLIREDVQKVQDKVPILGDVPWAGRLFRSDSDQKLKKNLVIFVTPRILDADGQPRRGDSEEPEVVTPLGLPKDLPQPQQAKLGK
jgi:general secretion pathway protein D